MPPDPDPKERPNRDTVRLPPGHMERLLAATFHEVPGEVPGPKSFRAGAAAGIELDDLLKRPSVLGSARVTCTDYSADQIQVQEVKDFTDFLARHRHEWVAVRWIDVAGLEDMQVIHDLAKKYLLHPLALEDMLSSQRPKADDYPAHGEQPGRLFVVAWALERVGDRVRNEQISLFLGRNTLLTFRGRHLHGPQGLDLFGPVRLRLGNEGSRLRSGDASFLFYSLLDNVVDGFFPLLEHYSDRLEILEGVILRRPRPAAMQHLHRLKRELLLLRRSAWAMRDLINQLHRDPHECLSENTRTYFRDVYDHVTQVVDFTETYREIASGLAETYISSVSNRLNEVMKTLAVIATIFVPLTFLAGVYGMNMPIPENAWPGMYPVFWIICLAVAVGMLLWFKRRGWF